MKDELVSNSPQARLYRRMMELRNYELELANKAVTRNIKDIHVSSAATWRKAMDLLEIVWPDEKMI